MRSFLQWLKKAATNVFWWFALIGGGIIFYALLQAQLHQHGK